LLPLLNKIDALRDLRRLNQTYTRTVYVEDLSDNKYAILMSCADRNLDTIFRSERPSDTKIRGIAKEIAADAI
jgi:hypothetical protein